MLRSGAASILDLGYGIGKRGICPGGPPTGPGVVRNSGVRHNEGMSQPVTAHSLGTGTVKQAGPWSRSVTPVPPLRSASPSVRNLVYAGLFTGAWSGGLSLIVLAVGRGVGVHVIEPQSAPAWVQAFPWLAVLVLPIACGVLGALGSAMVRGWRHASWWVWFVGTAVALLSLAGPLSEASWSARLMLGLMHVITWFLVVPQLARIVGDSEPGASVDRRD